MLIIRKAQMQVFRDHCLEQFSTLLRARVREDLDVEEAIRAAREYNFRRECDVARFAELVCQYLGGFPLPELPKPVKSRLWAYGVDPETRLAQFESDLREMARTEGRA